MLEEEKIALKGFHETRGGLRKHLRCHAVDVAEGYTMSKMFAEVVVQGGGAVPVRGEVVPIRIALTLSGKRSPYVGAKHGAGDEFIRVSAW